MGKNEDGAAGMGDTASMNIDVSALRSQRSTMKRNITRLKIKVEKGGASSDYTVVKCQLQILESYFTHISHIQSQIERLDPSDEGRSDLEEIFITAKALMVNLLDKKRSENQNEQSFLNVTTSSPSYHNRLPQLKLPNFDGKYSEYSGFIRTFTTLVHAESSIPTIDKFNYLLNCLSGQALSVVKPYPVTEENYQKVLDRLKERYDNKSLIFIDQVNALFSITPMNKSNATELRAILDKVAALRSSLLSLGSELDVMNSIIIHIVLTKIDSASKETYDEKQEFKGLPSWDECYNILSRRCQFLESRTKEADREMSDAKPKAKPKHSAVAFVTSNVLCEYCHSKEHLIGRCDSYLALPTSRRFDFVKSSKLCINCLRRGHISSKCPSKSRCRNCRVSHHTTLHKTNYEHNVSSSLQPHSLTEPSPNQASTQQSLSFVRPCSSVPNQISFNQHPTSSNPSTSRANIHVTTHSSPVIRSHCRTILPTAVVLIQDKCGSFQPARALLDSCSEINLITHEMVQLLGLQKVNSFQEVAGISDLRTQIKYKVSATIKSRINNVEFVSTFAVTKSISSSQPSKRFDIRNWNIPKDLELADPQFYLPQRVDLLLSAEIFFELLLDGKISFDEGMPHMLNTSLGWIIGGKIDSIPLPPIVSCNVITTYQELDSMLKSFWEIEEFSQNSRLLTEEENQCEEHFVQNTVFDDTGRVKAGLQLSKWSSNVQQLAYSDHEMKIKDSNDHITKALGMYWKPSQDVFCFRFEIPAIEIPTKRSVLSVIARIFDVLGLLSPIVVSCKILIQEMWKQQLDWDAPLNDHLTSRWVEIEKSLKFINHIEVPRFVKTSPDCTFDIHGFADASQLAYGCCIYIRAATHDGFQSTLLIAKSKVAPVLQQSLPRLELCAALLLSRTWNKIRHKFQQYDHRTIFWLDSKIVLSWLTNHSSSFVCFVANRISEIQNSTHNIVWRHVPSKQNPADVVSRGCLATEICSTIWFSGPDFLNEQDEKWPKGNSSIVDLPKEELRKSSFKTLIIEESIISRIISRHSSYVRILRVIAYVHRLFHKNKRNLFITADELQLVFWKVIHDVQSSAFSNEIDLLIKGNTLPPSLQKLSPFLHYMPNYKSTVCIIRVGGRLANSSLPYDAKFPALLPKNHQFTTLYVRHLHLKHLHAGPKALLGILRQRVWVVNARDIVRKVVRNCIHCFKYKPQLMQQVMGDLPANRLRAQRPFLVCGVDFCGPFYTSYRIRGKPPYKTYVAIFVCFASKAIHIELVSDLSTNAFLLCLKRFFGRRGIAQRLYCDNATNFVGASHKLQEFKQHFFCTKNIEALMHYGEVTGFQMSFIPPRSSHFGGLWESAVKSTKTILTKNMSQAGITYEELQTILIEIEAILNSRPLAPRSDDPNDGEALTPAHLLIGSSLLALPDEDVSHYKNINYLKRYQFVTYLKQQFWTQWVRDYVSTLQEKSKWFKSSDNVKEGTLVIIHEDNLPPQHWLLARITKAIPGRDGKVRVVDLKTNKGIYRRSIHKIAPLPMDECY